MIGTGGGNNDCQIDNLGCFGLLARKVIYCDSPRENFTSVVNPFATQVNLARRQGMAVSTETKYGAGGNTQVCYKPSYRDLIVIMEQTFKFQSSSRLKSLSERNELKHCKVGSGD